MSQITQFLISHGGPVLFAIVFVEQAGLPLPSAPWLLAAGALAATGRFNAVLAIGLASLAAVTADSIWFYIGRRGGKRVLSLFCRISLSRNSCICRTTALFERHGLQTLLASKFLPGLGAVMPPLAGAMGISTRRFVLFDTIGSLIYGSFYVSAGFLFHDQLGQAVALLNRVGLSAGLLAVFIVGGYAGFKFARKRKAASGSLAQTQMLSAAVELKADPNEQYPAEQANHSNLDENIAGLEGGALAGQNFSVQSLQEANHSPLVAHSL